MPRTFKQYAQERAGIFEDTPERQLLENFGIRRGARLRTLSGYQAAASDEPMNNILFESPSKVGIVSWEMLEGMEIPEGEIAEILAKALGDAKSPRHFWELLEDYALGRMARS